MNTYKNLEDLINEKAKSGNRDEVANYYCTRMWYLDCETEIFEKYDEAEQEFVYSNEEDGEFSWKARLANMKIDLEKVQALLDGAVTYDRIVKETGVSKGVIYPYRTGKRPIENMTIRTALKLQKLHEDDKNGIYSNQWGIHNAIRNRNGS